MYFARESNILSFFHYLLTLPVHNVCKLQSSTFPAVHYHLALGMHLQFLFTDRHALQTCTVKKNGCLKSIYSWDRIPTRYPEQAITGITPLSNGCVAVAYMDGAAKVVAPSKEPQGQRWTARANIGNHNRYFLKPAF